MKNLEHGNSTDTHTHTNAHTHSHTHAPKHKRKHTHTNIHTQAHLRHAHGAEEMYAAPHTPTVLRARQQREKIQINDLPHPIPPVCDMTLLYVCCDSCEWLCEIKNRPTCLIQYHLCVTWLMCTCAVTHVYDNKKKADLPHPIPPLPCVWHDSFIRVPWLIRVTSKKMTTCLIKYPLCDMTRVYVCRDSYVWHPKKRPICLIHYPLCVSWLVIRVPWLVCVTSKQGIHLSVTTCEWHDLCIRVTWLIYMTSNRSSAPCITTCVWRDSFIRVTWLISMTSNERAMGWLVGSIKF